MIYGLSCLAGIGFTMSLFIGSLSFDDQTQMNAVRMGVLADRSCRLCLALWFCASPPKGLDPARGFGPSGRQNRRMHGKGTDHLGRLGRA